MPTLRRAQSAPSSRPRSLAPARSAPAKPYSNNFLLNLSRLTQTPRLTSILTNKMATQVSNLPRVSRPKLVIKWGPPASGKGSQAVREAISDLGEPYNTYLHINIDAIVESTNYFKNTSRKALINFLKSRGVENVTALSNENISKFLNTVTSAEAKKLRKAYGNVRFARLYETLPLATPAPRGQISKEMRLSSKQDALLDQALESRRNVSVETTGSALHGNSWPRWLIDKLNDPKVKQHNYKVVVVFPLVPFAESWRRYRLRPIQSFMSGGGFRFASSRADLRNTYIQSYINFRSILNNEAQYNHIDKVVVLDPANRSRNIKYNSNNTRVRKTSTRSNIRTLLTSYIEDAQTTRRL